MEHNAKEEKIMKKKNMMLLEQGEALAYIEQYALMTRRVDAGLVMCLLADMLMFIEMAFLETVGVAPIVHWATIILSMAMLIGSVCLIVAGLVFTRKKPVIALFRRMMRKEVVMNEQLRSVLSEMKAEAAAETRRIRLRGVLWLLVSPLPLLIPILLEEILNIRFHLFGNEDAFLCMSACLLLGAWGVYLLLTAGAKKAEIKRLLKKAGQIQDERK